jgi:glc operon protein GlcG
MAQKAAAGALFLLVASLVASQASAQTQKPPSNPPNAQPQQAQPGPSAYLTPIGQSVGVDAAKKAAAAAAAEARKNGWFMAIAVVDPAGTLVYYEKADNTQLGSANVAVGKARSAALYKRPTKAFQDALAAGGNGLRILALEGAVPVEGGLPLVHDGKLVGAIGVSGDTSEHDGQCAQAGAQTMGAATAQR